MTNAPLSHRKTGSWRKPWWIPVVVVLMAVAAGYVIFTARSEVKERRDACEAACQELCRGPNQCRWTCQYGGKL